MKKLIILILCFYFSDLNAQQAIVCGNVKNATHKEFLVSIYKDPVSGIAFDFSDSINKQGDFKIIITDIENFIHGVIQLGEEKQLIFLEPNDSVYITVEDGKFDETIKYTNGVTGNNQQCYDAYFYRFVLAPNLIRDPSKTRQLDDALDDVDAGKEVIRNYDSDQFVRLAFIDSFNSKVPLSKGFLNFIKTEIVYDRARMVLMFPTFKKVFGKNKKPGTIRFPKIYDDFAGRFNINDVRLIGYQSYVHFLCSILQMNEIRQWDTSKNKDGSYKYLIKQKIIDSLFTKTKVKNVVMAHEISLGLMQGEYAVVLDMYEKFKEKNFDATIGEAIQYKINTASKLKPADLAPRFTLNDIDGKPVSLNDFKGKLVYIDFWATWCGPCKAEIPASEKLQVRYQSEEIVFVNISIDEEESKWKEFVVKNKLSGIQLRTNGRNSSVAKAYNISGVPEYVLIDKSGRIIKYGAPRPSDKSIIELFNYNLPPTKKIDVPSFKLNQKEY